MDYLNPSECLFPLPCFQKPICPPDAIVVIIVLAIIAKIMGCGDIKEYPAGFQCYPWEPPLGGSDCERCDDDSLHPCSEYRCKSLGASCEFVNEGTEHEACIWANRDDSAPPIMTPWQESLPQGYSFDNTDECPTSCSHEITSSTESQCLNSPC